MDEVIDATAEVKTDEPDATEAEQPIETESAFVVYLVNGHWVANSSVMNAPFRVAREANIDDFYCAASTISSDVQARRAAEQTVSLQMQQAQAMAQQQRDSEINSKIAQNLAEGKNLAGAKLLG